MNGLQIFKTKDFAEGVLLAAVVRRVTEIRREEMEAQAMLITNKLVEAWNKGNK